MGQLAVILLRLLVPLTILRWPLAGGLISMVLDALDVVLIEIFGGSFDSYSALDKGLDTYYLALEVFVSLRWEPLARWTSVSLFGYRAIGVLAFEVTQTRWLLLVFPNLFENFYIAYLVIRRFAPAFALTPLRLSALLILLLIPKLGQEYLLHYSEAQPWDWIKRNVLRDAWQF